MLCGKNINDMEEYVFENSQHIFKDLNCRHSEFYKTQATEQGKFKFLPGHRTLLLVLPSYVTKMSETRPNQINTLQEESFSVLLGELIKSAQNNAGKEKHHVRYTDIIRHFFTYVYLLCGRNCYETLNRNLPIPSTKTIRKQYFNVYRY